MSEKLTYIGKIGFDPPNETKKHEDQASWKRMAMVFINGDVSEYYSWFLKKRFNLQLNRPLRSSHISFINDSNRDLMKSGRTMKEVDECWKQVKTKWDGKEIPILLDLKAKTDGRTWWLNVHHEYRDLLHGIRAELGLGRPFFGLHMSLGYANEKNIAHSEYIHELVKSKLIT